MKNLLTKLFLFFSFIVIVSSFTACPTATTENVGTEKTPEPVKNETPAADSKSSEYPKAPAGVLQGDLKNLDQSTFKVADKQGNIVLLNLWATWCGPCRGEMPHLVEMENKYKDKGFEIIGLNVDDESVEDINAFAEDMKLNYKLAWADDKFVTELYKVSKFDGIPQSFLIDRQGHLRGVFLGGGKNVVEKMKTTVEKTVNE